MYENETFLKFYLPNDYSNQQQRQEAGEENEKKCEQIH